jgi:hypothetical protein
MPRRQSEEPFAARHCADESQSQWWEPNPNLMPMKQFGGSTVKKRNYTGYQKYRFIKQWVTGDDAVLVEAEIQHEIYTEMKKFMHASGRRLPVTNKRRRIFISGSSIRKRIATRWPAIGRCLFDVRSTIDVDVKRRWNL